MTPPFRYRLSDREKDALLSEQAALIERQAVLRHGYETSGYGGMRPDPWPVAGGL